MPIEAINPATDPRGDEPRGGQQGAAMLPRCLEAVMVVRVHDLVRERAMVIVHGQSPPSYRSGDSPPRCLGIRCQTSSRSCLHP